MRVEANAKNDRGRFPDGYSLEHILLQLQRSPQQEQELEKLINEMNDRNSPNFHQWLTSEEIGDRFGVAPEDVDAVTGWLESHGFVINKIYPATMMIDFSGNAGQIRSAFNAHVHTIVLPRADAHRQYEQSVDSRRAGTSGKGYRLAERLQAEGYVQGEAGLYLCGLLKHPVSNLSWNLLCGRASRHAGHLQPEPALLCGLHRHRPDHRRG